MTNRSRNRRWFAVNMLMSGLILGLIVATLVLSCSTRAKTSRQMSAQDRAELAGAQLVSLQESFREIAAVTLPSVVRIDVEEVRTRPDGRNDTPFFDFFFNDQEGNNREFRAQGLGSGVVVRRDGNTHYVLTNAHVIGNADEITVTLDDGTEFAAVAVGRDVRKDLALVSFESRRDVPTAVLGDSDHLRVGDWVLAIGSPFGFQSTVTAGIVSALGRRGGPENNISDFIQTDAAINRGNSGGALVNLRGEVVGINTWISSQTGGSVGLGFSIPVNNVVRTIDDFIETGAVRYGWLGVSIQSINEPIQTDFGLPNDAGAMIYHVFLGSPADSGGLLPGDFVTAIDGRAVDSSDALVLEVGELRAGSTATFDLIRGDRRIELEVSIGERESEEQIVNLNARLWPGFSMFPLTDEVREELQVSAAISGVPVISVANRSPAAAAGIREDDIIVSVAGRRVDALSAVYAAINAAGSDAISIELLRDGETIERTLSRTAALETAR